MTVDIHNDTDRPELRHWYSQKIPSAVDGAEEEGSRASGAVQAPERELAAVGTPPARRDESEIATKLEPSKSPRILASPDDLSKTAR